jgi:DNA-binding CsgD family transcriptional regulator
MLQVIAGCITAARGDLAATARTVLAARDALRSARYEDQYQLPLARLEILLALGTDGPAAALAAAVQALDRFEESGGSPRYVWPVVTAGASAVLAVARLTATDRNPRDQRLRDEATAVAARLRTVAEKLEAFGRVQQAHQLTFAAADASAAQLLAEGPFSREEASGPAALLAAWDEAAAAWAALSEPYPLAWALLAGAQVALADGDREGATERLQRAGPLAAGLDAHPLGDEIAVLARRAGLRQAGQDKNGASARHGAAAPGGTNADLGLTGRELEVLRLVAAGRSNREIAAELFISPKTASVHVSNILGKLGAASRGEAAAKAHTLRLFDSAAPA